MTDYIRHFGGQLQKSIDFSPLSFTYKMMQYGICKQVQRCPKKDRQQSTRCLWNALSISCRSVFGYRETPLAHCVLSVLLTLLLSLLYWLQFIITRRQQGNKGKSHTHVCLILNLVLFFYILLCIAHFIETSVTISFNSVKTEVLLYGV